MTHPIEIDEIDLDRITGGSALNVWSDQHGKVIKSTGSVVHGNENGAEILIEHSTTPPVISRP
jgi:hypothetical protein